MHYDVFFDMAGPGYRSWQTFFLGGLVGVVVGIVARLQRLGTGRKFPSEIFPFAFAVFWCLGALTMTWGKYWQLGSLERHGEVQVVAGPVCDYKPGQAHVGPEQFCVDVQCFSFWGGGMSPAFELTAGDGSPIRQGLPVRITYAGDDIIKLEIGRKGSAPDPVCPEAVNPSGGAEGGQAGWRALPRRLAANFAGRHQRLSAGAALQPGPFGLAGSAAQRRAPGGAR